MARMKIISDQYTRAPGLSCGRNDSNLPRYATALKLAPLESGDAFPALSRDGKAVRPKSTAQFAALEHSPARGLVSDKARRGTRIDAAARRIALRTP